MHKLIQASDWHSAQVDFVICIIHQNFLFARQEAFHFPAFLFNACRILFLHILSHGHRLEIEREIGMGT